MTKSILITGCSSGIGRHCALGLKDRGWRVFATARQPGQIAELEALGLDSLYLEYGDEASIDEAVDHVLKASGGRLDVLFNNAGYAQPGALEDVTAAAMREQFDANFFGWHDLTRRIVPIMRGQKSGRIVMNSSILGIISLPLRGAYNASKHAMEAYCDTLRLELDGSGIYVSSIQPGPITSLIGVNALKAAKKHLDHRNSIHYAKYKKRFKSLQSGGNTLGLLGPEAVLKPLIHACESDHPRTCYRVTYPTHLAALGKRIIPTGLFHKVLRFAGRHT